MLAGIDAAVLTHLRARYGVPRGASVALELLSDEYGKRILAVRAADAGEGAGALLGETPLLPWVVRVYPAWRRTPAVEAHARVLRLLEGRGYPAPRAVLTVDGGLLSSLADGDAPRPVLVTTYVEGQATKLSLPGLRAHGETLGRLHALPVSRDHAGIEELRPAGMLPQPRVQHVMGTPAVTAARPKAVVSLVGRGRAFPWLGLGTARAARRSAASGRGRRTIRGRRRAPRCG